MSKKRKKRVAAKKGGTKGSPGSSPTKNGDAGKGPASKETERKKRHVPTKGKAADDAQSSRSFVFPGVVLARPYLLLRLTLVLLAFDCFLDLVPHGGRYGVGNFNVAHFHWMDAVLPTPSPALYLGTLIVSGVLALAMALRPYRPGLAVLFGAYTYAWSMSMLDSYQHHYLISLLLFSCIFLPLPTAAQVVGEESWEDGEEEREEGKGRASSTKAQADTGSAKAQADASVLIGGVAYLVGIFDLLAVSVKLPGLLATIGLTESTGWVVRSALLIAGVVVPWMARSPKKRSPDKDASEQDAFEQDPNDDAMFPQAFARSWAYVSVGVTCAIVYFYTAVTKLSPDWRDGHALRRIGHSDAFVALEEAAREGLPLLGPLESDAFWSLLAKGAIAVQLVSAMAFLLGSQSARLREVRLRGRVGSWLRDGWLGPLVVALFGLAPLSFHLGAETMGLEIGWFSYYMLLLVIVFFSPAPSLVAAVAGLSWPWRKLKGLGGRWLVKDATQEGAEIGPLSVLSSVLVVIAFALWRLWDVDLPGSTGAGVVVGVLLACAAIYSFRYRRLHRFVSLPVAALVATLGASVALSQSEVRYDYYRFVGGDHRRRGEYEAALEAYEKANRYLRTPYCVFAGQGRAREKLDCFATEEEAQRVATGLGPHHSVERSDRRRQEEEMRQRVEQERAEQEPVAQERDSE